MAAKDLALTGDSVTIDPGVDARTRKRDLRAEAERPERGIVGHRGRRAQHRRQLGAAGAKEGDGRLTALQNTKAALSGVQAAQAWGAG